MKTNSSNSNKGFMMLILILSCIFYKIAAQSYTFTPCGATGRNGPTQVQVNTAYSSNNLNGLVIVTGGIQSWTVPVSGNYRVEAFGAQGGGVVGGMGAGMAGDFFFAGGTVLNILAGQQGSAVATSITDGVSGGGGSYVVGAAGNLLLVVAGGGGGNNGTASVVCNGTISLAGHSGFGPQASGIGGVNGAGGAGINYSSGGGGFVGNGGSAGGSLYLGGLSYINGGLGGYPTTTLNPYIDGGFGGGGMSVNTSWRGAGGGGGYSGGGSGNVNNISNSIGGGGGASFNTGINQVNTSGTNVGNGKVIITLLCDISLTAVGVNNLNAICVGGSVTLSTNAASNYSWSTGAVGSSIIISPTTSTVYSLTATGSSNCNGFAHINVIVESGTPTLTVMSSATNGGICPGKTLSLTATGASSYTWAGVSTVTNGVGFVPSSAGIYTVTGANACNSSSAITSVSIHPSPTLAASVNPAFLCSGETFTLNVSGSAITHTWAGGQTSGIGIAASTTTTYSVTGSNTLGCTVLASVVLTVNPIPIFTITSTAPSGTICVGEQVSITASGAATYTWATVLTTSNTATIIDSPTTSIIYNLTGESIDGCMANALQVLIVHPNPTISVSASRTLVCAGGQSTLTAGGANTFTWSSNANSVTTHTAVVSLTNTIAAPTTFTVIGAYSTTGCKRTSTVNVHVYIPVLTVSGSTNACYGSSLALTPGGGATYSWSPGTIPTFTAGPLTVYTLSAMSVSAGVSCLSSKTIAVEAYSVPIITATASSSEVCKKENVTLSATGGLSYLWSNAQSLAVITVSPLNTTIYTVTAKDGNSCSGSATVTVIVSECTEVSTLQADINKLMIYPNPNEGHFAIKSNSDLDLFISNELGGIVHFLRLSRANDYKISIADLPRGIYFVKGRGINQKIIVTK